MYSVAFLLLSGAFFFQQLIPAWIETRIQMLGTRILKTTTAVFRFSKKQRIYVAA
jgi:hypothetical protein